MTLGYWIEAPGRGSLRAVELPTPGADDVALDAICTGVSPGTERLVGLGRVPPAMHDGMACRGMQGSFALPALYGYSFVGRVRDGADAGRRAFVMRPHQQAAVVAHDELIWLPNGVPDARATLFANLETARNAAWDADTEPGDRVLIVGAGPVGLLCAFVLGHDHASSAGVVVVERDERRRERARGLPWIAAAVAPDEVRPETFDHALHTSASDSGLQLAIDAVGFEGQVVELSWYGDRPVSVQLGGSFHAQRKRLIASQVGAIAPAHRAAGHAARHRAVLDLLLDARLDAMLDEPVPFAHAPETFLALYQNRLDVLCPVFRYDGDGAAD
ncbi:MAG: dehydrogenase [Planctomycetes bacterium]|nr:dehydrogenase [Planctomycetota bacterium]